MEGHTKSTPVVAALLLYYTVTLMDPVSAAVSLYYYPTNSVCRISPLLAPSGDVISQYVCGITPDNKQKVLHEIRADHISVLHLNVTDRCKDFVFGNASFSKHLEHLDVYAYYPILISAGAFMELEKMYSLKFYQHYDSLVTDAVNTTMSSGGINLTSLEFEHGWLTPITTLKHITLSHNSIKGFPDMQFCNNKGLKTLDISSNKISSSDGLGIVCNSSHGPTIDSLSNVYHLSIAYNPITHLNINISDILPSLTILNISGCLLSSVHLSTVLSIGTKVLDISHNSLSSLVMEDQGVYNSSSLTQLYLQDNRLQHISAGFFVHLRHLKYLDLSGNLLTETTFISAGINLLTELERLDVSHNKVTTLHADLIGNMVKLQNFTCRSCQLTKIVNDTFIKLENLRYLRLDDNTLHSIEVSTFKNLTSLEHLDLSSNSLPTIPKVADSQPSLKTLILAFNQIRNIPNNSFSSMPFLNMLDMSSNRIKTIEPLGLDPLYRLTTLRLNNNSLAAIPQLPPKRYLENIDLSRNRITSLHLEASDNLIWVNLAHNDITKFESPISSFGKLRLIDVSYNNLRVLSEEDFLTKTQPRPQVLLQGNPLHCDCQMEWILDTRFNRPYEEKHDIKFQGGSKPKFKSTKYQDISRQIKMFYAEVADLDVLHCTTSHGGRVRTSLSAMSTADFVCSYQHQCNDWKCYEGCCTKDANCPCRGFCYPACSCYRNHNHAVDFMNCTSRHITNLPHKGPMYVTHIYLDGNNLTTLSSDYLDFPDLTALFVNKSNVLNIHAGAFKKMKILRILDLHQNYIERIVSDMFVNASSVNELYLHNNRIHSIENNSFQDLVYLRTLRLHGNNLKYLNFSLFEEMSPATELTLRDNPWFCDCDFGPVFQKWLIKHYTMISDIEDIHCVNDTIFTSWSNRLNGPNTRESEGRNINDGTLNHALIHIDFSIACNNLTILVQTEYKHIKSITEVVSLAAVFGAFMILVVVVYQNLLLIKVYVYNRFGVRFHCEDKDNVDRPYDIFVVYARQDEWFVLHHILPALETGYRSYRICLESRDWPPGADTAETIIASVQQSKRTILLVSEHHFSTQWCEFSFEAGHYQVLIDKQIRLIIMLTDGNLQHRMNRTMKMYVRTNAFLLVGEKWFWKKLRYYLADNPRGADEEAGREFRLMEVYKKQQH